MQHCNYLDLRPTWNCIAPNKFSVDIFRSNFSAGILHIRVVHKYIYTHIDETTNKHILRLIVCARWRSKTRGFLHWIDLTYTAYIGDSQIYEFNKIHSEQCLSTFEILNATKYDSFCLCDINERLPKLLYYYLNKSIQEIIQIFCLKNIKELVLGCGDRQ